MLFGWFYINLVLILKIILSKLKLYDGKWWIILKNNSNLKFGSEGNEEFSKMLYLVR